jgi:hypothetical protein
MVELQLGRWPWDAVPVQEAGEQVGNVVHTVLLLVNDEDLIGKVQGQPGGAAVGEDVNRHRVIARYR